MRLFVLFSCVLFYSCQNPEQVDPIVATEEVQNIGTGNAAFIGSLVDAGASVSWVYGFVWSDQPGTNVVTGNLIVLGERTSAGEFSVNQENLNSNTQYYVKAYVADKSFSRIYYAAEVDFRTLQ